MTTKRKSGALDRGSETELAEKLLLSLSGGAKATFDEGSLHRYGDQSPGLWLALDDSYLSQRVQAYDGLLVGVKKPRVLKVSHRTVRGTIALAYDQAASRGFFAAAPPVLVFSDRAVRITAAGEVERLKHSPDHRARAGYPFPFDPKAKAPRFQQMLREHFEGDKDAAEKIATLQEFFGACLFATATRFQKCLALPSDGGGGRSTFLAIMEAAMPAGTVAHLEAKELRRAERRAKLPGKRLCFSDEVPSDAFLETEDFKKICVGNTVTGEQKYRPSFDFRPICGLVFPIQVAASAELTDAFFRRFIIVRYNHNFEGSAKRDYGLASKIIEDELPGVVAWMVEGAARLLKRGHYLPPPSHADEEAKWKLSADTVRAFLDADYTKAGFKEPRSQGYDRSGRPNGKPIQTHDWTAGSTLYGAYRTWCETNGHRKPVAIQEFKRRVEKIGYPLVHTHKGNFFGVRELEKAQRKANEQAEAKGKPPERLKGAVSILQGARSLTLVNNSMT